MMMMINILPLYIGLSLNIVIASKAVIFYNMSKAGTTLLQSQEYVLQTLFTSFSQLAYDKARELADREKDVYKSQGYSVWSNLLGCISQLAMVEKLYMNLHFLAARKFLRKETNVRLTYETLLTELAEMERKHSSQTIVDSNSVETREKLCSEGVLIHLRDHLLLFIQARLQMIAFYEKLVTLSAGKIHYSDMLLDIKDIYQKNDKLFHHPLLAPIRSLFTSEVDLHIHLLSALNATEEWNFLQSLLHLSDAHSKLLAWRAIFDTKESKKYTFTATFLKSSPLPRLYEWLWECKSAAVSKFSLYFHEKLSLQSNPHDMKNLMVKQSPDFVAKIQMFHKKYDAHSICLILDADGLESFHGPGPGYHHPSLIGPRSSGLDLYPAIYSYPMKPVQHWPGIIMQITKKNPEYNMEKVGSFHDDTLTNGSYFFILVDLRVTMIIVYETKRLEKDTYIKEFLLDIAHQLRLTKVFASLKL